MSGEIYFGILAAAAAGVVLWLAKSKDKETQESAPEDKQPTVNTQNSSSTEEDIEPLSPEEARKWLDVFLVKQQDDSRNS